MADENKNENEVPSKVQALADVATDEDKLFHDGYVKGVSEFLKECATPMTIAIQGDWGAGKTTLINLIEAELRAKEQPAEGDGSEAQKYCKDVINVMVYDIWRQAVVDPKADLFEGFFSDMISKLSGSGLETLKGVSEFASAASEILGTIDILGGGSKDDSPGGSILSSLFGFGGNSNPEPQDDPITSEDIDALRNMFVGALKETAEACGKSKDSRLVVFVDGLDLINPETAIDFMEEVKTYMDCPRCILVHAVDEKIVFEGLRRKHGDKVDEGRKKMLFDKLVQVPLRIPASAYNLDNFIKTLLKDDEQHADELVGVINILLNEPTPRRVKRYVNSMYLYRNVFDELESAGDGSLAMMFAAVILKVDSVRGFNAVAECARGDEEHFAENVKAALDPLGLKDGINWAMLPDLWRGGEDGEVDIAKRSAFLSWVRKLK